MYVLSSLQNPVLIQFLDTPKKVEMAGAEAGLAHSIRFRFVALS